jgi:hypothetical protein
MRISWKGTIATVATAGLLVVAADYVSFAATGDSLVLGRFNIAKSPTTLTNQGDGPVLRLNSPGEENPPLAVNSSRKVLHLNADALDGMDAKALSTRVLTYAGGHRREVFSDGFAIFSTPLEPGVYQTSFRAGLFPRLPAGSTGAEVICAIADLTNFGGPNTKVFAAQSAFAPGNTGAPVFLSGTETVRITDQLRPAMVCLTIQTGNDPIPFQFFAPMKASFVQVASRVHRIAEPAVPPVAPGGKVQQLFR